MKSLILISVLLCHSLVAQASGIRTAYVNDTRMHPINLKMGKASVLRFAEKPVKVVIGNQNYYSIEFIENDLTIQPLGKVETNLFVYTPYHTYGFILRVCSNCRYDDLVYVKWKSKYRPPLKQKKVKKRVPGFKVIGLRFNVGKEVSTTVIKTTVDTTRQLRFVDLQLKNRGKAKIGVATARIVATRGGVPLPDQGYVIGKDFLGAGEATKARLFLPTKEVKDFTVNVVIGERKGRAIISQRYLK